MKTIFIDGQTGTTGLEIAALLEKRNDIQLIKIADEDRKNAGKKKEIMNEVDLTILCLPDEAAKDSVSLISNPKTKVLDASTAHRVNPDWVYGLPELEKGHREKIKTATKVSNPGCYPTGFILALKPLIAEGIVPKDYPTVVHAVSGYSGGGKKLIEHYEGLDSSSEINSWKYRPYGFSLKHKHISEMKQFSGLKDLPNFNPAVSNFERGMLVTIPLHTNRLNKKISTADVISIWEKYYDSELFIHVEKDPLSVLDKGFLNPLGANQTNRVDLFVFGNEDQLELVARLDNLGKGASGAAIQNLNLMLGFENTIGLNIF